TTYSSIWLATYSAPSNLRCYQQVANLSSLIAKRGVPAAWARSIVLGNFEPAECHPESTIAFERVPLFADENEGEDKLAVGGREIDATLLPFVGTLLDSSSFEIPGRLEHAMRCWIEGTNGVVCGLATRW